MAGAGQARGWTRALVAFVTALIAVYLTYLFGMLFALNSAPLRLLLNPHPERVEISWKFAWSPWPLHVHARGLRIAAKGWDNQWQLDIASAEGDVALPPLLKRTFDARNVVAHGAGFRFRPVV